MTFSREVFAEIARWRQEAWDEPTGKYFFPMPEADQLIAGDKCFVVSRKGTGKSALAKHLLVNHREDRRSSRLSLDDFPYENFRAGMANEEEQSSQKFELGWQYVIYCEIASLMMQNPAVSWNAREQLRQVFDQKSLGAISNIRRWTSPEFWAGLIEAGLQIERRREKTAAFSIRDKRDAMREFVLQNLDSSLYLIVFDGLDAGYARLTAERHSEYIDIVSSLFSAIRAIRNELAKLERAAPKVRLIVFLRDDIFAHVSDANREKYWDDMITLKWNEQRIKGLLAFRFAKAASLPDTSFDVLWKKLCGDHLEFTLNRKWNKFEFISSFTFLRPRDYVYYLSRCCQKAMERAEGKPHAIVISADVLQLSATEFSRHFRREIEDEIGGEFSEISRILDVFEKMERRVFTKAEFEQRYTASYPELAAVNPAGQIFSRLFDYSVVGNLTPRGQDFFKYMGSDQTRFRQFEDAIKGRGQLVIHKGLVRDLGVH